MAWHTAGRLTTTGAIVSVKAGSSVPVRLLVSTSPDLAGGTFTPTVTPTTDTNLVAKISVGGLTANTQYYYGVEENGVRRADIGRFRTAATEGVALNVRFAFGTCTSDGNRRAFTGVRNYNPFAFFIVGDLHYADLNTTIKTDYQNAWDRPLNSTRLRQCVSEVPLFYTWSDHDYCGTDHAGRAAVRAAYRDYFPPPLVDTGAIYYAFSHGRVRFIMLDTRSERDPVGNTDNSTKFMLSPTQEQWLKDQCTAAATAGQVIMLFSDCPYIHNGTSDDGWQRYKTQRARIAQFWADNNMQRRIVILHGDAHMLAGDDGTNSNYSTIAGKGPIVLCAASFGRGGSTKGGPYTTGTFPDQGQYGIVQLTDSGGDTISGQFSGRRYEDDTTGDYLVVSLSFTLRTTAATVTEPAPAGTKKYTLSFQDNANNEEGFYIEESVNGGAWARIATLAPANATGTRPAYIRETPDDTNKRKWRFIAFNAAGTSSPSQEVTDGKP